MALNVLPDGGRGTGVEVYNNGYPFVDPDPDVRGLLADAYLVHDLRDAPVPFRVARLAGFDAAFRGEQARCDLRVVDAAGATAFDSAGVTDYRARDFGPRLRLHEWYAASAVCRVVQHTAFPDAESAVAFPAEIAPADGTLDARVCEAMPERTTRLTVADTGAAAAGAVSFVGGYNTTITPTVTARGLRVITELTWDAGPGGGLGRFPGCATPDTLVRTVNGVAPDPGGDFRIDAAGCYWIRRPSTLAGTPPRATPVPAALQFGNDCGPCCTCDDFAAVQQGVLRTWHRYQAIAHDAEAARNAYALLAARWEQERACVDAKVVSVAAAGFAGDYVEVVAGICNHTRSCLIDATLTLAIFGPTTGSIPPGSTSLTVTGRGQVSYQLKGTWPAYTAYLDSVQAMNSGALRTRLQFPPGMTGQSVRIVATGIARGPTPGLALPQSATAVATIGA